MNLLEIDCIYEEDGQEEFESIGGIELEKVIEKTSFNPSHVDCFVGHDNPGQCLLFLRTKTLHVNMSYEALKQFLKEK